MLNLEDLMRQFDKHESYVNSRTSMELLMYEFGGYNHVYDAECEEFDFEDEDCIFTIRKYDNSNYCELVNDFVVHYNGEWIEVCRC